MNFTELLTDHNVSFKLEGDHHHARYGWAQLDCPFCGKHSNKFHMGFNLRGGYCNCWKCGSHSLVEVTAELLDITLGSAQAMLKGIDSESFKKVKVKKGVLKLPKGRGKLKAAHRKYLRKRKFTKEHWAIWGLEGIGIASKLKWRIFIPIHYRGEIVSWTTRSITNNGKRYISAAVDEESINHKTLLYGEDFVRHAVCCVEGPFDAWRIGPGAVATCGVGYSRAQLLKLSKHPVRAICFDSSKAAQARANELCDALSVFPGETYNVALDAPDPAEASTKEIRKLRKAINL